MRIVVRVVGFVLGVLLAFPLGLPLGCGVYEASGPEYRECGYEFEGTGHVLVAIAVLAVILGFLGQWLAGWLWRRFKDE